MLFATRFSDNDGASAPSHAQEPEARWDLSVLYAHGLDDPKLAADQAALEALVDRMRALAQTLAPAAGGAEAASLVARAYELDEELAVLVERLAGFLYLSHEADTTNAQINNRIAAMENALSNLAEFSVALAQLVKATPLEALVAQETLKPYAHRLSRQQDMAQHQLTSALESLYARLSLSGGEAWSKLHGQLTSTVRVRYRDEEMGLQEVRNLAYDPDPQVRLDAFKAEMAAYPQIEDSVAFALNNIKREVKLITGERGFASVLAESAFDEDMTERTLEALIGAMERHRDIFVRYLQAKAQLMGYQNGLPFYELFAPLGQIDQTFSVAEAKAYLTGCFADLHQPIANLMARSFDERWIDFYPREGKSGGAFCHNLPQCKQSRILHNYDGTFNAVQTLAHELGHAYHGERIECHRPLNCEYGMTVAETASTFNETHLVLHALKHAKNDQEKLAILENFLQGTTQVICDIYSRFLFEREVIDRCDQEFLPASELRDIMARAQVTAYGAGLDPECLHPNMWIPKGHYYSASKSFYNYPYAFGALLSMGLYTLIQAGTLSMDDYDRFLTETTVASVEEVGALVGLDLSSDKFWEDAICGFEPFVAQFEELCARA